MQNQEIQQSGERKASLDWSKWDVIFFVLPIILIILEPLGGFSYLDGRFDSPLIFLTMILMLPVICVIIIICFLTGIVRLLVNWKNHTRKKKLIIVAEIGMSLVFITLFFAPFFIPEDSNIRWPGYKPFTYGFRDRIRSKVDVKNIRDWLKTLSKEDCTGETIRLGYDSYPFKSKWPDSIDWPKSLKVFNPGYIELDLDENGNPKVRLTWGGPPGHWGVEIGMKDMEIPASDFSQYGEYRLPVEPGVYVWSQLQ
ncbi:MAG: hypothetical protein MUO33_00970 [Sedimentisphaerales bacterium]|nr:hypothetical protein [Sedimentisphaerales bacterium]